jgi:hypothetical protein
MKRMSRENILAAAVALFLAILLGGAAYLPAWVARTHNWDERGLEELGPRRHPSP